MIDRLKIRARTGDTVRAIIINLGTFNEDTRSWKIEIKEEAIKKLVETFSTPEARASGVSIVLENDYKPQNDFG